MNLILETKTRETDVNLKVLKGSLAKVLKLWPRYGYGSGNGSGYGDSDGYGYGNGSGNGNGYGYGDSYSYSYGDGDGNGCGYGSKEHLDFYNTFKQGD